ncbi:arylsulfatase B-like [Musca domestica]|uniref:Arylsulfatase B-like n=1 Tax=Musca domestica TaxID=7370 RepID=A0A1I8MJV9_MUSDO|nr:arylsulfatase B-like [Musca domestica]
MRILWLILKIGLVAGFWSKARPKQVSVPPNMVIILADDLGFDDISFRGNNEFLTPNIDALAYHGRILQRHYTPAVCTPSRATLLTGLYPIHTGTQHFVLLNEEPWGILENHTTMAEVFQAHGYSTNLVGKWHMGMGRREYTPTFNGFDQHYGYWGAFVDYYRRMSKMPTNFSLGYDFRRNMELEYPPEGSYVTNLLTQEAEDIILRKSGTEPLFLLVSHLATHASNDDDPLQAPLEEMEKFSYISDVKRRTYAAMASKLDESVGRIIQALDKARMLSNSIILFLSDNGAPSVGLYSNTGSNWPLKGQKNSPWEGGLRVPGVIWSPLLKNRGSIFHPPIYMADWLPTLAAASKIELDLPLDGLNLWPDLVGGVELSDPFQRQREIVHMLDEIWNITSYMRGQWKYIQGTTIDGQYDRVLVQRDANTTDPRSLDYEKSIKSSMASLSLRKYDRIPLSKKKIQEFRSSAQIQCGYEEEEATPCDATREECLYDLSKDPCEQNNLASQPGYESILQEMRERVESLRSTAVPPKTGGSLLPYDPSYHDCVWSNFVEDEPTDYVLQCSYESTPCQG